MVHATIGLDFDNTIIRYDAVFSELAATFDFLPPGFTGGKVAVRDAIRGQTDGERKWQTLQAAVYGRGISDAAPYDGVRDFLFRCHRLACPVVIVSHKTRFAAADPGGVDLRRASLAWLAEQGLFDPRVSPLSLGGVYFADSRAEKVAMIRALGCRTFVDDLEEVFRDPAYPSEVEAVLFAPDGRASSGPWRHAANWWEVADVVLARR